MFAIIVFGIIADKGTFESESIFNGRSSTNSLAISVGVLSFLVAGAILAVGFISVASSALAQHVRIVRISIFVADIFMCVLFFICPPPPNICTAVIFAYNREKHTVIFSFVKIENKNSMLTKGLCHILSNLSYF